MSAVAVQLLKSKPHAIHNPLKRKKERRWSRRHADEFGEFADSGERFSRI
jgi:hypothetical protein